MCTQWTIVYTCGCKIDGAFRQCDRLYVAESNLQCGKTCCEEELIRNYCSDHMPAEDKASIEYRGRYGLVAKCEKEERDVRYRVTYKSYAPEREYKKVWTE